MPSNLAQSANRVLWSAQGAPQSVHQKSKEDKNHETRIHS